MTNIELETLTAIKNAANKLTKKSEIDWEQRRYEIAKDCYTTLLVNRYDYDNCATAAVLCADELIKVLNRKETSL